MHSVLMLVVFSGILSVTIAENCANRPGAMKFGQGFRKLSLDGFELTQYVLSDIGARSDVDCGLRCLKVWGCVMFTFLPHQNAPSGDCRLYGQLPSIPVGQQLSPGARSYAVNDICGEEYSLLCGRCLRFLRARMPYVEANQTCRQLDQGHLLLTKTLDSVLCAACKLEINGLTGQKMWVGADDLQQEGSFFWNDGTTLDTDSEIWANKQPDNRNDLEHCALFDQNKQAVNDANCDLARYVICEKDL